MAGAADTPLDSIIVGGGPAGLTAAIYLARYRRRFLVIDAGAPRAAWIPLSHNHAGFPDGVTGMDLLARMRAQAKRYGAPVERGCVASLRKSGELFVARTEAGDEVAARTAVMATGVIDVEPVLPNLYQAVQRGLIRHCPICDGFEVIGQRIGVLGHGADAVGDALWMRTYTDDVTLLTLGEPLGLSDGDRRRLAGRGIRAVEQPVAEVHAEAGRIAALTTAAGERLAFDTLYSALGAVPRTDPARPAGARTGASGRFEVDAHCRTDVEGLFAIGDVVEGLNQISVAMGHAAIAATTIHRTLLKEEGRL
ncbi:NAD(P)/FAD-dependent oxidoreductase [Azospirillum sp. TSO22-1]|uniref:NAD(P)/FAD-dependent oxidoreductase n=1 Tax=Azospirillum sp. TSO22-1 TaxID=716789 RepID=UPI000D609C0A|nr:NAD(P)/FAD-dependent oxidoreductase [Azospirillum sp. TSO22-1]PWC43128.1 pyridine nucleotide-disulfide oxidoreductase [Azospirillum sp. TSO22-1]